MDAVFAYGSLINSQSHGRMDGVSFPVRVRGLRRGWYLPVPDDRDTGLGIVFAQPSTCNGILIPCEPNEIVIADLRETEHGYKREQVPRENVVWSVRTEEQFDNIWVYVTQDLGHPTDDCPIAQSYLDVVIAGCLSIDRQFAEEFIRTTEGWEFPWVNDRTAPRYRRAIQCPIKEIDELLRDMLPERMETRVVEKST